MLEIEKVYTNCTNLKKILLCRYKFQATLDISFAISDAFREIKIDCLLPIYTQLYIHAYVCQSSFLTTKASGRIPSQFMCKMQKSIARRLHQILNGSPSPDAGNKLMRTHTHKHTHTQTHTLMFMQLTSSSSS